MNQGEKFKIKRLEMGLTQTQLAEILGIAKNTISNYETSQLIPKIKLEKVCKALNWDIQFFTKEDNNTKTIETRIELLERKVLEQDKKIEQLQKAVGYYYSETHLQAAAEPAIKYKK